MGTNPSSRGRLALAIVGLSIAVACSGNTTSPTPQPTPAPPPVPPVTPSSAWLLWPLGGRDGRDWVINNYVDLDATTGTLDYTGASGSGAKTHNGHNGIDIDVPNFRWMDGGVSIVLAAASGVVTSVHDNEPDRNTSCTGNANLVQVRHADGLRAVYGHLRKGSVVVSVGQEVSAGAVLGVVGSSGCSTAPHLHFELRDAANRVVDPFRNGLWAAPPIYNTPLTLMRSDGRCCGTSSGCAQCVSTRERTQSPRVVLQPLGHLSVLGKEEVRLATLPATAGLGAHRTWLMTFTVARSRVKN